MQGMIASDMSQIVNVVYGIEISGINYQVDAFTWWEKNLIMTK